MANVATFELLVALVFVSASLVFFFAVSGPPGPDFSEPVDHHAA